MPLGTTARTPPRRHAKAVFFAVVGGHNQSVKTLLKPDECFQARSGSSIIFFGIKKLASVGDGRAVVSGESGKLTYLRMLLAVSLFAGLLDFQPDKANASLIGDTVGCTIPNAGFLVSCSPAFATVGAGVEFIVPSVSGNAFTLDVDASSVTLTSLIGVSGFIGV